LSRFVITRKTIVTNCNIGDLISYHEKEEEVVRAVHGLLTQHLGHWSLFCG